MSRIFAFANQKGGVGKTATAVNLGAILASQGSRVLLVDLDPQGNATSSLGVERAALERSLYDVLLDQVPLAETWLDTTVPNFTLAPSTAALAAAEVELANVEAREYLLQDALAPLADRFDLILVDCPPSLGLLTVNALAAADDVLVPVQCEYLALEGLAQLLQTIALVRERLNPRLALFGLLMTMFDGRANLSQQVVEQVRANFPAEIFQTIIPRSVRIAEAPSYGKPLLQYDRNSRGAQAYVQLAAEFRTRAGMDGAAGEARDAGDARNGRGSETQGAKDEEPDEMENPEEPSPAASANYEYSGQMAANWDLFRGDTSKWPDRFFYRDLIERFGQPVLDVGCGTGRLLLDYLAAGIDIDGVDISPEMLALCRQKAAAAGLQPSLYEGDMENLNLPRRYRTILVPSSSFQLVIDPAAAAETMRRFARHLEPGGALVMPFMLLHKPGDPTDTGWKLTREAIRPEDGATVRRHSRAVYDPAERLEHTEERYEVLVGGQVVSTEYHRRSPATREYTQEQSAALFRDAGLTEIKLYREFTHEPAAPEDWIWTVIGVR